ncbi:AraC family transcriptional regulator [SAR92 clade bacterium H231]|nr:AraC family transcriptional regulator [SAR92 clade bacterium H231]
MAFHSNCNYQMIDSQMLSFRRTMVFEQEQWLGGISAAHWVCEILDLRDGEIQLQSGSQWLLLKPGKYLMVVPAFSGFKWKVSKALMQMQAIIFQRPYDHFFLPSVLINNTEMDKLPQNRHDLSEVIEQAYSKPGLVSKPSEHIIAERAKMAIGQHFRKTMSLGDIAQLIHTSPAQMSRHFKQTYLMTPVEYRTELRIAESVWHLLKGCSVGAASEEVGFTDLSRFNKNFKQINKVSPAAFKKSKNAKH